MNCPNCNKENGENVLYCEQCGTKLQGSINAVPTGHKKLPKKFILSGILVVVFLCCLLLFFLSPKKPNTEQLKADITEEILEENFTIFDLSIDSESIMDEHYTCSVIIVYGNEEIECREKYNVFYSKNEEWTLESIDESEPEKWEKKPLKAPTANDLLETSKEYLNKGNKYYDNGVFSEYIIDEYDVFKVSDKNSKIDLKNKKAFYFYEVNLESPMCKVDGVLKFEYRFDEDWGRWDCVNVSCEDDFSVKYNFLHTFTGSESIETIDLTNKVSLGTKEILFELKILEVTDETIICELKQDDVTRKMSGTIEIDSNVFAIEMTDIEDEHYYFEGKLYDVKEGTIKARIYGFYNEYPLFYRTSEVYDVDFKIN